MHKTADESYDDDFPNSQRPVGQPNQNLVSPGNNGGNGNDSDGVSGNDNDGNGNDGNAVAILNDSE